MGFSVERNFPAWTKENQDDPIEVIVIVEQHDIEDFKLLEMSITYQTNDQRPDVVCNFIPAGEGDREIVGVGTLSAATVRRIHGAIDRCYSAIKNLEDKPFAD